MSAEYLENIKEQLNLDYSYNFNNLKQLDINLALKLLLFDLEEEQELSVASEKHFNRFKLVLELVVNRALEYIEKTFPKTNEYNELKKYFYSFSDFFEFNNFTPNEIFKYCWPAPFSPNIFVYKNDNVVDLPHYVHNAYDIGRWWRGFGRGRDPLVIIEFSLYTGCEINCEYCPQLSLHKASRKKLMSFDEYKSALDKIPSYVSIVLAGFIDPLLYKDLPRIVEYTKNKKHKLYIATTLPDKIKKNVELFLNKSNWDGRTVHLRDEFMNYKENSEDYYKALDIYFSQFNDKLRDNRFSFLGSVLDKRIEDLLHKHNLYTYFSKVVPYKRIDSTVKSETVQDNKFLKGSIYCTRGFYRKQMIAPDGDVVLCCMDVEKRHILGNIYEMNYNDIYKSEEYKKVIKGFNDETLNTICRKCVYSKNV
jgi:radical SAM protein with 4Fe4S-binding SPASM domain